MITFLFNTVAISLVGVMFPGPVTAASLAAGSRFRHAGLWIAVGHGLIEVPLILLLACGIGEFLDTHRAEVKAVVGLAGGGALLWMGGSGLHELRTPARPSDPRPQTAPLRIGVVLTVANPYFLIWWSTIGLALIAQGLELGALAFGVFIFVHWLCDLVWLEVLSLTGSQGASLLSGAREKAVLAVCACVLLLFGCKFLYDAGVEGFRILSAVSL